MRGRLAVAVLVVLAGAAALTVVPSASGGAFVGLSGKIAFDNFSGPGSSTEIFTMNGDGSGVTRITNNAFDDELPMWSPDGTKIVFSSSRDGNFEVYVMNADGSGQTRLTNNPDVDGSASFSPGGNKIAFTRNGAGGGIFVMNADGSGQAQLPNTSNSDSGPQFSPDGTKIAFTSFRDGDGEIYVMNADGSNLVRLTLNPAQDTGPVWSPDGAKIVFTSDRQNPSNGGDIYTMNADGTFATPLTSNGPNVDDRSPYFSSENGQKIVFVSDRDSPGSNPQIWSMNADGSGATRLTSETAGQGAFNPAYQTLKPSNKVTFGPFKRNKRKGTGRLSVKVPSGGTLKLGGNGVVQQRPAAASAKTVAAAGTVKLTVKAKGKQRRKLLRTGRVKLKLKVTFTPDFGTAGVTTKNVVLKLK